jgi:hypothetical protein
MEMMATTAAHSDAPRTDGIGRAANFDFYIAFMNI